MTNPIYTLLSKQVGLRQQVDLIAHNVANLGTTGFKREGLTFAAHLERLDVEGGSLAMTEVRASHTDFRAGPLEHTGNPFDLALEGGGVFAVETPGGVRYTRDGRFATNQLGELVTMTGYRVLDEGGAPIVIPPQVGEVTIAIDGTLRAPDGRALGVLGIRAVPEGPLRREADGLFATAAEPGPALEARVVQGFLEGSNVNAVRELTDLIETQRAYERGRAMLDAEDQRIRRAIERLDQQT
jgi:flagellar basal-body rod protein FlgF